MIESLVRSRHDWDCGIATAAMVANVAYEDAEAGFRFLTPYVRPVSVADMMQLLPLLGVRERLTFHRAKPYASLRDWTKAWPAWSYRTPLIAVIATGESDRPDAGHWIAVEEGRVFDPACEKPVGLRKYDRLDWWAVWFSARSIV